MSLNTIQSIFSRRMLTTLLIGYASGLPLLLTGSTLQAWMKNEEVDLTSIGMVSLIGLPYVLKFLWAPLLDRFTLPFLGRRRGWMLVFQILIILSIFGLSTTNPKENLLLVCIWSFFITLFSASQDVVIDAYRREILTNEELGLGSSLYVTGYRLAMLVSGAFALYLADQMEWGQVFQIMSALMIPAVLFTFIAPNENQEIVAPKNLKEAVIGPLLDFFHRKGAWIFLLFILLYKVGDSMASNMTTPFILDIGYTKTDIASVAKTFGMLATIIGGIFGGMLMLRMNLKWALTIFGVFQAISTLGFAVLPTLPIGFSSLALVIAVENLASGMGTAAYSAYMASLTNKRFTATQYALLTALMGVPRVILSSPTGLMAESMGWQMFFVFCTVIALPGMLLLYPMFKFAPGEIPNSNIKIQNNFENPKVKLVAYLQIIGPILLLCTMCYLYFKASEVTEITAFQLIPFLIMTSSGVLSALAGVYLLKKKEIGIKLTIINLSLQIINFSFKGVSWIYLLGIGYLVNYTGTNSGSKFGFSYSLINFNYFVNLMPDFNDPNVFISVNFFPITLIILLMKGTQTKTNS